MATKAGSKKKQRKAATDPVLYYWPMVLGGMILYAGYWLLKMQAANAGMFASTGMTGSIFRMVYVIIGSAFAALGASMLLKWIIDGSAKAAVQRSAVTVFILAVLFFGPYGFWFVICLIFGLIVVGASKDVRKSLRR